MMALSCARSTRCGNPLCPRSRRDGADAPARKRLGAIMRATAPPDRGGDASERVPAFEEGPRGRWPIERARANQSFSKSRRTARERRALRPPVARFGFPRERPWRPRRAADITWISPRDRRRRQLAVRMKHRVEGVLHPADSLSPTGALDEPITVETPCFDPRQRPSIDRQIV